MSGRGRRRRGALVAVVALVLAAGAAWWFTRPQPTSRASGDGERNGAEGSGAAAPVLAARGTSSGSGAPTGSQGPPDGILRRHVEGRIEGPAGAPLDGTIELWAEGRTEDGHGYLARLPVEPGWVHADASGRFSCAVLFLKDDAPVWVTASFRDPQWVGEPARQAKAGDTLVIRLATAPMVQVTVRGPNGQPIVGAEVAAWLTGGENPYSVKVMSGDFAGTLRTASAQTGATTDAHGVARLAKSDVPGLNLRVSGPSGRKADEWLLYEQPEWVCADTAVVLEPAMRLEGRVEDPQGKPVTEGAVEYRLRETTARVKVEYDGTFEIERIPPGPVALRFVDESAPATANSPETTGQAGATDVVVRATFGAELLVRIKDWPREAGGTATLTPEPGTGALPKEAVGDISIDGTVRFRGLVATASYILWIPPSIPGLHRPPPPPPAGERTDESPKAPPDDPTDALIAWGVYRAGVKPGAEPVEVVLAAGRTIVAQVTLPTVPPGRKTARGDDGPFWSGEWRIRERGLTLEGRVDKTGRLLLRGVPTGSWTLSVRMSSEVPSFEGDVDTGVSWWAGEGTIDAEGQVPTIGLRPIPLREDGDWWAR